MPKKLVINCTTGEESEVEMTPEEVAQLEEDNAKWQAERLAREEAEAARAAAKASAEAKLAALGLTADEIATL